MVYVDTSALIALFVQESRSQQVTGQMATLRSQAAISAWVLTEAESALRLRVRTASITASDADAAGAAISKSLVTFHIEPILDADFYAARSLLATIGVPLRAADALHIAICLRLGADLLTLDREMAAAGQSAGLAVL